MRLPSSTVGGTHGAPLPVPPPYPFTLHHETSSVFSKPLHRTSITHVIPALGAVAALAACSPEPVRNSANPPVVEAGVGGAPRAGASATAAVVGAVAPSAAVTRAPAARTGASAAAMPAPTAKTGASAAAVPAVHQSVPAKALDSIASAELAAGRSKQDVSSYLAAIRAGEKAMAKWPEPPAPLPGSIFPASRIVAFYGNPLSKKMGALGEYPADEMLARLDTEVVRWRKADPSTPVQPALHLIAVVAQGAPGRDGKYRLRMDSTLIEKVYGWAQSRNALLFLDIQVGKSTVQEELPRLLGFLSRPNVHLGIDPEFSMHYGVEGRLPSTKVGEMRAADINYAVRTLAELVAAKHLPPKVLVIHRWTRKMVVDAEDIHIDPHVQVVMDMDGWGPPWLKFDSYRDYIVQHPVEYTGFKLFFHHDMKKGDGLLTPIELLRLRPRPLYIQYQ